MKKYAENSVLTNAILFVFGGLCYGAMEIMWRGYTHWSMLLAGGICFITLFHIYSSRPHMNYLLRFVIGSAVITTVEFTFGCVVNLWWGMNVWDYSRFVPNLWGQICLLYSVLWGLLCIPVSLLCIKLNELLKTRLAKAAV